MTFLHAALLAGLVLYLLKPYQRGLFNYRDRSLKRAGVCSDRGFRTAPADQGTTSALLSEGLLSEREKGGLVGLPAALDGGKDPFLANRLEPNSRSESSFGGRYGRGRGGVSLPLQPSWTAARCPESLAGEQGSPANDLPSSASPLPPRDGSLIATGRCQPHDARPVAPTRNRLVV